MGRVEFREEENYYFKLEQHKHWLLDLSSTIEYGRSRDSRFSRDGIAQRGRTTWRRSLHFAAEISAGWGIELPFDHDFVTYVWFDALTNYISFAGYDPNDRQFTNLNRQIFRDKWPALQIIGKDILVPAHGIYWPIMLHALGFPDEHMPQLLVHGWWNLGGAKMSKSAGNIVDPFVLADKYGADALRYYLMSDIVTGEDADFSEDRLVDTLQLRSRKLAGQSC